MSLNYVKGLKHKARYPIGFIPYGSGGCSTVAILHGGGVSESDPEVSSTSGAHFIDYYFKTTNTGALETYGGYIDLQSAGAGTGYAYTLGLMAKSVSGGSVAELAAAYFKTTLTAGTVTGQCYVGFFELTVDSGVTNMPSGGVIQLVSIVNGTLTGINAFIVCREYGTNAMNTLVRLTDTSTTPGAISTIYSPLGFRVAIGSGQTAGTNIQYIPVSKDQPSTTGFFGRGASTSSRESMGTGIKDAMTFFLTSNYTGSSDAYGLLVDISSTGTAAICKYAITGWNTLTSGTITEIWGGYFRSQLSGGQATGQVAAATFEMIVDSGVTNMPSGGVIQLCSWINGNISGSYGFLNLREYGSTKCANFIYSPDLTVSTKSATAIFSSINTAATNWSHALKINIAGTNYWIMCTTTTPAA